MLEALRTAAGTWVAKLLLLLLVRELRRLGHFGPAWSTASAAMRSSPPAARRFRRTSTGSPTTGRLSVLSQQFGTRLTREQAKALGIDDQVLAQLVAGAVLDEQARKLGLGLSQGQAGRS